MPYLTSIFIEKKESVTHVSAISDFTLGGIIVVATPIEAAFFIDISKIPSPS